MKKILILGSTGSIGTQTLDVIRKFPGDFKVVGLSTNSNVKLVKKQAREFKAKNVGFGEKSLVGLVRNTDFDLVVVAVVGGSGIMPTLEAIRKKKEVALATKEVMVMAGDLVLREAKKYGVSIIPVDSEMSAIFQCLRAGNTREVKRLILTMGKGKIARMKNEEFNHITIEDVFGGGRWKMGDKITVDSATCVNKAFEVIEARYFFDIPGEKISVTVHPEYICHSLVEFVDGSIVGEFGTSDMRRYIQHALFYPERRENELNMDIIGKSLSFEKPPLERFPCLGLGHEALDLGGTAGAVLHGADRAAVELFLAKKIIFLQIYEIIEDILKKSRIIKKPTLEQIFQAEEEAYKLGKKFLISN